MANTGAPCVQIHLLAFQWGWNFTYPNGKFELEQPDCAGRPGRGHQHHVEGRLPFVRHRHAGREGGRHTRKDKPNLVRLPTSEVSATSEVKVVMQRRGTSCMYIDAIRCFELCGVGHARMVANFTVVSLTDLELRGREGHSGMAQEWLKRWLFTTNHKDVGILYFFTSCYFGIIGAILALMMRVQLSVPNNNFLSAFYYNQAVTMHGLIMIFWFLSPIAIGLANYFVPLQIGAKDLAFPRSQCDELLDLPRGRCPRRCQLLRPRRDRQRRLDHLSASRGPHARERADPGIPGDGPPGRVCDPRQRELHRLHNLAEGSGHDLREAPDVHLVHALHDHSDALRLSDPDSRLRARIDRPDTGDRLSSPRRGFSRRYCGTTCSGSSATRRCTSSSCPDSASSPTSSPSSPGGPWQPRTQS